MVDLGTHPSRMPLLMATSSTTIRSSSLFRPTRSEWWAFSTVTGVWREQRVDAMRNEKLVPVTSNGIVVVVSPDNDRVWAYSHKTGMWREQRVATAPNERIVPALFNGMTAFKAGRSLYAFGAEKGTWDAVPLAEGEETGVSFLGEIAIAQTEHRMYAFSSLTSTWDTVEYAAE